MNVYKKEWINDAILTMNVGNKLYIIYLKCLDFIIKSQKVQSSLEILTRRFQVHKHYTSLFLSDYSLYNFRLYRFLNIKRNELILHNLLRSALCRA